MMIVMSGKPTATSSIWFGCEYFSRNLRRAHAGPMRNGRCGKSPQLVRRDDLVQLVGQAVVRKEALAGRMKLEPPDDPALDQFPRSRAPIMPLCGSMLAKAIMMSLLSPRRR